MPWTSNFARHGGLSDETLEAYRLYGEHPRSCQDRLKFYHTYLIDVAPWGVTIEHIPADRSEITKNFLNTREEIHLLTPSDKILMSGLVSTETRISPIDSIAGDEAYTHWYNGSFIPDDQKWRFFTAQRQIRFFKGDHDNEWEHKHDLDPIRDAREVAAYLLQEYCSLRFA